VGAGAVDLGVSLGDTNLGVTVDLGLDDAGTALDTGGVTSPPVDDTANPGNVVTDVVDTVDNALNGLLRRPGRK